jgi:acetylornithine deacetylase
MPSLNCDQIAAAVAARSDAAQRWLTDLITFPSTQGQEAEAQAYLRGLCRSLGLPAEYRPIPESLVEDPEYCGSDDQAPYAARSNLVCDLPGAGSGRSLILQTHMDVVPAGDWAEAFSPRVEGGFVHGRGATDCKGCVVTILLALCALRDLGVRLAGPVQAQFVIEEEVGGNGALALIRQGCSADGVIVVEASGHQVFPANRGALWFRLKTTGISAHMGRRHEAVNAIEKAMEACHCLLAYEEKLVATSRHQPLFERYENPAQLNLGMIRGGAWPSMVPEECVVEGGVGFLPNRTLAQVKQELTAAIESSPDLWLREHYELTYPRLHKDSYAIDPAHPLVTTVNQAALACGLESEIFGWNVSCDAALYARLAGLPTVVYGPSDIREAHSSTEKIQWSAVLEAAQTLALSVANWCGTAAR